jgi:rhodanese-related sulfurtransferase
MELAKAKEVCPTTTQGLIKNGALLVDVREWNEVKELAFDVPNIMVIPLSEFEERYQEIPKDKYGCCGTETSSEASETKTSQSSCCEPSSNSGRSCC